MGTCVSVHKDPQSALRFKLAVGGKKASPPSRPKGGNEYIGGGGIDAKTKPADASPAIWSPRFGSKEEIFFDSQAWLESDCEDFHSVNGEFTPSRGSTPNFQTGTPGRAWANRIYVNGLAGKENEPSPRKKLAEFFRENPNPNSSPVDLPRSIPGEEGPTKEEKRNEERAAQCCLPGLTHGLHFSERKK